MEDLMPNIEPGVVWEIAMGHLKALSEVMNLLHPGSRDTERLLVTSVALLIYESVLDSNKQLTENLLEVCREQFAEPLQVIREAIREKQGVKIQ